MARRSLQAPMPSLIKFSGTAAHPHQDTDPTGRCGTGRWTFSCPASPCLPPVRPRWGAWSFVADDPESAAISRRAPGSRAQPFARRSSGATPSHAMASRPAIASRLQAHALVGRTAELGSMDFAVKAWVAKTFHPEQRSVPVLKTIVAYWNSRLPVRSPFR